MKNYYSILCFEICKKEGPTEIRTRVAGFKVQSDSHYTIGPMVNSTSIHVPL